MWWVLPRGGPVTALPTDVGSAGDLRRPVRRSERGVVLIWASLTVMLVAGIILAGTDRVKAMDDVSQLEWEARGQVYEVARAGLVDAYAWLRRQTAQPVTTFQPLRIGIERPAYVAEPVGGFLSEIPVVTAVEDVVNETDDPDVGLTRSFEISENLWARYICRPESPAEPFVDDDADGRWNTGETFTDVNGNGSWDAASGCRDTSVSRGSILAGSVWELQCEAEVYYWPRKDLAMDQSPNRRMAQLTLCQEVRRLGIRLPAEGALVVDQGNRTHIQNRGRLRAPGATAIAYADLTGHPLIIRPADVIGGLAPIPSYYGTLEDVFGVPFDSLRSMADLAVRDISSLPQNIGNGVLVTIDGDVVFDDNHPLRGTGVVVVRGNCTLESGNNSFFSGLLFVDGHLEMKAPAYVRGSVIVTGDATLLGTGGDYAEIEFDIDLVNDLISKMSRYRESKTVYRPGMDPLSLNGMVLLSDGGYTAVGLTYLDAVGQVSRDWNGWADTTRVEEVIVPEGQAYDGTSTSSTDNRGGPGNNVVRGGRYVRDTYFDGFTNGNVKNK